MASLQYLTAQDILWINLQVTKKVQHFNYARLEEAVFYQYAYGDSKTLLPQAARFITGFAKMHPFEAGNEGTAFISCLAFLEINGYTTTASGDTMRDWNARAMKGQAAIDEIAVEDSHGHHGAVPDVRNAVRVVMDRYSELVSSLDSVNLPQTA